ASGVTDIRTYETWQNRFPPIGDNLARLLGQVAADLKLRGHRIGFEQRFDQIAPNAMIFEPTGVGGLTHTIVGDAFGNGLVDATDLLYELRAIKTPIEI